VATDPEALAQLARLLGNHALRTSSNDEVRKAVSSGIERLAEGLVAEAAASDDVTDGASATAFVESRMSFFKELLDATATTRLKQAVQDKIDAW
jgi:hypothetical protein